MAGNDKGVQIGRILEFINKIIIIKASSVWNIFLKDEKISTRYLENVISYPCYLAFQNNKNLKIL